MYTYWKEFSLKKIRDTLENFLRHSYSTNFGYSLNEWLVFINKSFLKFMGFSFYICRKKNIASN